MRIIFFKNTRLNQDISHTHTLLGSELQNFFTRLLEDNIKALIKPQYVDNIPRAVKGKVQGILKRKNERGDEVLEEVYKDLELSHLKERKIEELSGGELQRFAISVVIVQQGKCVQGGGSCGWGEGVEGSHRIE